MKTVAEAKRKRDSLILLRDLGIRGRLVSQSLEPCVLNDVLALNQGGENLFRHRRRLLRGVVCDNKVGATLGHL